MVRVALISAVVGLVIATAAVVFLNAVRPSDFVVYLVAFAATAAAVAVFAELDRRHRNRTRMAGADRPRLG